MKQVIFDKAAEMFGELGVRSVTMDDLARNVGISKKTIYQYFSSKDELVEKFVEMRSEGVSKRLQEVIAMDISPIEQYFLMNDYGKDMLGFQMKAILAFEFNKYYPEISQKIEGRRRKVILDFVEKNLKIGIEQGFYREDIDIDFLARLYFVTVNAIFQRSEVIEDKRQLSIFEINIKFIEHYLRGVVTPEKGLEELKKQLINRK